MIKDIMKQNKRISMQFRTRYEKNLLILIRKI